MFAKILLVWVLAYQFLIADYGRFRFFFLHSSKTNGNYQCVSSFKQAFVQFLTPALCRTFRKKGLFHLRAGSTNNILIQTLRTKQEEGHCCGLSGQMRVLYIKWVTQWECRGSIFIGGLLRVRTVQYRFSCTTATYINSRLCACVWFQLYPRPKEIE